MKVPHGTYDLDRQKIKAGLERPLGQPSVKFPVSATLDLFNPNVVIVTDEGSGRSMGS